jgi:hypothetical protein
LYWVILGPSDSVTSALEDPTPVVIEPWMKSVTVPFSSRIPTMSDVTVPVTDQVAIEVTSWVHLLMANCYSIGEWILGLWRSPWSLIWLSWKVILGVLGAFSVRPGQIALSVARRVVVRGRGCVIHPSAVVEGSVLGRNVFVGPHCVIRGSILGDGVHVMEYSVIDGCVIGDGAIINQRGYLKLSLLYPEAVLNWMVTGVVGRRTFLGELFIPLDMKVVGEIKVRHRGELVGTGLSFLGCCFGHRVYISGESRIRAGRVVPNDYKIISDMTGYLDAVPADLPTDHVLYERGGVLEPLVPIAPPGSLRGADDEPGD